MKFWSHFHHPQAAMVLLRVTLAVLLLFHGWAKLRYGIGSICLLYTSPSPRDS